MDRVWSRLHTRRCATRGLLLCALCLIIVLVAACAGDNAGNETNAAKAPDYAVAVGKSLNLSAAQVDQKSVETNSVLSITIEWSIVSPEFDPNSPPPAEIINPNSTTPIFVAYVAGTYVLRMVVTWTDSGELLAEREITIEASVNDILARKPANHIASSDVCFACHAPKSWLPATVDHSHVIGACSSCHDNVIATGLSPNHIPTSLECDVCHVTSAWLSNSQFPAGHGLFTGNCLNCHDGIAASGKGPGHLNSSDMCDACHSVNVWIPAFAVDHTQVIGSCESCHNGVLARGKSPTHVATNDSCDFCHSTLNWLDVYGCTNANPCPAPDPNQPPAPPSPPAPDPNQPPPPDPNQPPPPTQGSNVPDHTSVVGACIDCHDGVNASGKSATHIPSSNLCDACHAPAPQHWAPLAAAAVDHSQVLGVCSSCHDGSIATGKSPSHVVTTRECDVCHTTLYWLPPPPPPGTIP